MRTTETDVCENGDIQCLLGSKQGQEALPLPSYHLPLALSLRLLHCAHTTLNMLFAPWREVEEK